MREAVKRELSVLQQLDHPHIVHVLELLVDETNMYIVMELIEHGNLMEYHNNMIKKGWTFTERDAANIVKQILMALNYMHKEGVVHRDLKMENVMVDIDTDANGEKEIICKLTDFGFACVLEQGQKTVQNLGTPIYMAPEIVLKQSYDNKVDTWALGILTYCLLSGGKFPYDANNVSQIYW